MRILHTSDWHLGKRLENYSRIEEQQQVLAEICTIADTEEVDLVLLAGDMFDTFNPTTEAINLYYTTLKRLTNHGKRAVVLIAGNHDSSDLIEAVDPLARACGIITAGYPDSKPEPLNLDTGIKTLHTDKGFVSLKLPNHEYPVRIILSPYANEKRLKKFLGNENEEENMRNILSHLWQNLADKYCDNKGVNLFVSHLFFAKKGATTHLEPDGEKPILHIGGAQVIYTSDIPKNIQYTALGHLHRQHFVDGSSSTVCYSGSPIAYSFAESNQEKYVMIIDVEPNENVTSKRIKLANGKKLLKEKFNDIDTAIIWLKENQDALVELTIVSDSYLKAIDRKHLFEVHSGIINIIPEINNSHSDDSTKSTTIDLDQNIEQLFTQYFQHKYGQQANEDILDLLKEVISTK